LSALCDVKLREGSGFDFFHYVMSLSFK
jgi:hypothetical protein